MAHQGKKAPNTKLQDPEKLQHPTPNGRPAVSPLRVGWPGRNGFGAWSLEFIWILVLGAYLELEVWILELLAALP
jgi:hypothetical protein